MLMGRTGMGTGTGTGNGHGRMGVDVWAGACGQERVGIGMEGIAARVHAHALLQASKDGGRRQAPQAAPRGSLPCPPRTCASIRS